MRSLALLAALPLAGCLGSVVPYKPGFEPRPEQESVEAEELRVIRLAVPAHIDQNDWYLAEGRRTVSRIMAESPRNPWNDYEEDLLTGLKEEHAAPFLKDRLPAAKARLAPKPTGPTGPAKKEEAAAEGEGGGGE